MAAGEVGELVGVSGTTIGQWARRGYVRASQSAEVPHVYSVEDVGEASIVAQLLRRGVRHADVRRAIDRLAGLGAWPLSEARLATTVEDEGTRPRIVLREDDAPYLLGDRGWQRVADGLVEYADVGVRLRHPGRVGASGAGSDDASPAGARAG